MKHALLLMLLLFGLFSCQTEGAETEPEANSTEEVIAVTLTEAKSVSRPITIKTTGLLKAGDNTRYAFKIGGIVEAVYVDEDETIRKGQLLAKLRMTEIDAQVAQAELGQQKAQRDLYRVAGLYQDSIATLESYQNVQTQFELTQKALEQVKFNQQYASIYASSSGQVAAKLVNPGEVVGPGSPVLLTNDATPRSGYVLECSVNDRQWAQINKGDACKIELDAYPAQPIEGRVSSKSIQADPVSGAFRIEIALSGVSGPLAAGMYGKVNIATRRSHTAVSIPYQALVQANGNKGYVYTTKEGNKVEKVAVEIDRILANEVLLATGLDAGQKVVLGNSAFLSPASTIKIRD
jgi:RND family efflux transporter MFP subunit